LPHGSSGACGWTVGITVVGTVAASSVTTIRRTVKETVEKISTRSPASARRGPGTDGRKEARRLDGLGDGSGDVPASAPKWRVMVTEGDG
jgi:hypothetical protein